jgi:hypothetical protein
MWVLTLTGLSVGFGLLKIQGASRTYRDKSISVENIQLHKNEQNSDLTTTTQQHPN